MPVNDSLAGHIALVTGATGSIGAEVARTFAARGARVAVHGRSQRTLDELTEQIRHAGGTGTAYAGDVRDEEHLGTVVADVAKKWGPIGILVTLAGGDGAPEPTASLDPGRWRDVIEIDLTSVFLTVHAVLPGMLEHGEGRIVTVASTAGRRPSQANAAYGAAKAGVIMLTEHIAKEYASSGIRANCVAPSIVETATLRTRVPAPQLEAIAAHVPLGRIGRPSDVADAIVFFASDRSSWVTGTVLDVTGGMSL
ncbi:SDR family NAD(P)-dependent oxidoreductase [Streptomyces sp. NBC_01198]|uniref:SDR family NAD(P)-dependent oxidoreductase n=1 Tax=Streptomyces sp. NBC_01198 TaxID=2903769 RepID=UPI002E10654C|nr:SDR family oxidoreductase [Streptomyces sp. NBC_01198]